jgi:paraquat-inducible protein A
LFPAYRLLGAITPWSMLEVYMLGLLVAIVKLSKLATIESGTAFYAFCLLIFTMTAASSTFEPSLLWANSAEDQS